MNILFDVWYKLGVDKVYSDTEERVFKNIYNYIYDRLLIIDKEIESEEKDNNQCAILVYLMTDTKAILPKGYSEKLTEKILGCFNENDAELLWASVENDIQTILN